MRQFWIWPVLAFTFLALLGYVVNTSIRDSLENRLQSELETLLHVERSMLEKWLKNQESNAIALASHSEVRSNIMRLATLQGALLEGRARTDSTVSPREEIELVENKLKQVLLPGMAAHSFSGFFVVDREQRFVAAQNHEFVGMQLPPHAQGFFLRVLEGESTVSIPFASAAMNRDKNGNLRSDVPIMLVGVPVRNEEFQIVASLAFSIRPEREFTEILQLGKLGKTGETYAIDKNGQLISNSRFDEELMLTGLIPDKDGVSSILNVSVKDPGGNLQQGFRPKMRRSELPLTKAATAAIEGTTGVSLAGNRNYRGVPAVAAWTWLPKYQMGVITEITTEEAFGPLTILRRVFFFLFGLLTITSIAILAFTLVLSRLRQDARKAAIEAKQLGQYRLEVLLGTGAMGAVYKGHHSMMRRPTAIKLLKSENVSVATIERFEHEVQLTCQLNNPHTVAIYDYGRTPEGVFYYAMEYLDGINLQNLVEQYGPQPAGRVATILKQICSSLYEAHSLGLVHRDIKPANIMLNKRGGECDVVKVLDFGLVRSLDDSDTESGDGISGTPMYMPPEAIQNPKSVDVRSDIYSLGAVGYFLLTGESLYQANSLGELFQQHIDVIPEPPSKKLDIEIPAPLEYAIMACLEKSRANRPQTTKELSDRLDAIEEEMNWCRDQAEAWWLSYERDLAEGMPRPVREAAHPTKRTHSTVLDSKHGKKRSPKASAQTVDAFDATLVHGAPPDLKSHQDQEPPQSIS